LALVPEKEESMRHAWRTPTALALAALTLVAPFGGAGRAQTGSCPNPTAPEMDLRDGYFVNLEEGPVHPLELTADGRELWAVNIPDASVVVFDATVPTLLKQKALVKVGLGPVSVRRRPVASGPTKEMWVVCQSSNAVFILDAATKRLIDSIRLAHEPAGLVFDAAGARAWVTLGASNQVAEVNAATRTVTSTLDFATHFPDPTSAAIHAEEPRALLLDGSTLLALSFESGNGTFGLNGLLFPNTVDDLWGYYGSGASPVPPPDRDVLRLPLAGGTPANSVALWRAGSINFDLQKDNAGEIWVSNVDFNNTLVGEFKFPSQLIARHRLTHAPPLAPGAPAPTAPPPSVDLNTAVLASLKSAGYACSMPNEMAFSAAFDTLYVACYETHNVAVVDLSGPSPLVVSELRGLVGMPRPQNVGVRGLALHETAGVLYAYSRDSRVQSYAVPAAAGAVNTPLQTLAIGFDITPRKVLEGRFHNINALRAASKVQSCNTCHVDGHLDRLAWDLSDKTGDLPANPLGRVSKETKVTMSLRGIEETAPFHWRGDRADLAAFNPAFQGLLGATQLSPSEMAAFSDFVFSLSYPANPRQALDRKLSPQALAGLAAFRCPSAHAVSFDSDPTNPPAGVSCQSCHGMAGGSATNNQVNNDIAGLLAEDATQLRGLFDKDSDIVDYSAYLPAHLQFMPATLWGFASSGFVDTVADFVNIGVFNLISQTERDDIVKFLNEFDSGMPPAAAYAWTLTQANSGAPSPPSLTLLKPQADLFNIDLIVRGWQTVSGVTRNIGLLYDPATNTYLPDTTALGPQTYATLVARAAAGRAVYAFIGVPRRSGARLALDQEMDAARDGDEAAAGAVVGRADTDADGFPDGYEMRLGSLPGSAASLPPAEAVAPAFLPAPPQVSWVNGTLAKVRWTTDEESTSRIEAHPPGLVGVPLAVREDIQLKKEHVLVLRGLQPGQTYDLHVKSTDPAASGNTGTFVIPNVAVAPPDFRSMRIAQTTLTAAPALPGNPVQLTATFQLVDETGAAIPNGATVTFNQVEWIPGTGNSGASPQARTTGTSVGGIASLTFTSHNLAGAGGKVEVHATGASDPTSHKLYFHPLDGQFAFWAQTALP
jgi:hypothetical protein